MPGGSKLFSIEEANLLLPQLEKILTRLIEKKESHDRLHDQLFMSELLHEAIQKKQKSPALESEVLNSGAQFVDGSAGDLAEELEAIKSLGCLLRSLERCWIEFPAEKSGEPFFYCWKKGEARVSFYRPANGALFERFPL